jgi:two-component system, OmpR family, response regulator RpaB
LRLVRANLEKVGFVVSTAAGGAAALEQFDLETPDAIVVDVTMPGMDGFTFTQRKREVSNVPIIFLTAMGEQSQKVRGLELGADDYITKPFDPEELVARVRALLRRSSASASGDTAGGHIIQAGAVGAIAERGTYGARIWLDQPSAPATALARWAEFPSARR